jgi:hypothetical protein
MLVMLLSAERARAEVPSWYTGTPYQGTAQAIPGRVELADMDLGGIGVAWDTDWNRMNSDGYQPISGNDYRSDDQNLPNICKTNRAVEVPGEGSEDFWEDDTRYPSEEQPYVYYMGYAHVGDWVRVTVNVQQAGTYNVSSSWACDSGPECGLSIWFNDGSDANAPEDGVNKSGIVTLESTANYHIWREYPNFAQVELSAGLQLMTFRVEVAAHLQYGFLQFDLVGGENPGGAGGMGGAAAGGASAGGAAGSAAGGVAAGGAEASAGAGGAMSAAGVPGSMPSVPAAGGAAGAANIATGGTTASSGGAPSSDPALTSGSSSDVSSESGCSIASPRSAGQGLAGLALVVAAVLLNRRRRTLAP